MFPSSPLHLVSVLSSAWPAGPHPAVRRAAARPPGCRPTTGQLTKFTVSHSTAPTQEDELTSHHVTFPFSLNVRSRPQLL